jgi:hypothetical protein
MRLIQAFVHGISRSKLITILGLIAVAVGTLDPALFEGHPRVKPVVLAVGAVAAALGRALLHDNLTLFGEIKSSIVESMNSRTLPLLLVATLVFPAALANVGCNKPPPPSPTKLAQIAQYGKKFVSDIEANATLPDELLAQGLITKIVYEQIIKHGAEAKRLGGTFNKLIADATSSPNPDWGQVVTVVGGMIAEVQGIEGLLPPGLAQKLLAGAQIALRLIANYFALQVSDAHAKGYTDSLIARGLNLSREDFTRASALAVAYARTNDANSAKAGDGDDDERTR